VASPTVPVVDDNGDYVDIWYGALKPESPVESLRSMQNALTGDNLLGNLSLDYSISDDITFRSIIGVNLVNRSNEEFYPEGSTYLGDLLGGLGGIANRRISNYLNENTIRYIKSIAQDHSLEILGGFTWQREKDFYSTVQPSGFPNNKLGINSIGGTTGTPIVGSGLSDWSIASLLARVNYDFDD